jgi:hypothetical protein
MRSLIREPLIHFLLLGALLLAAEHWFGQFGKPVVEVTSAAVQARARVIEQRLGNPLSGDELAKLTDDLLLEEILYHEALRRGMAGDNRIRGSLVQMMRSALKRVLPAPADDELRRLQATLPKEVTHLPPQIAFDHVSFASAPAQPPEMLTSIRSHPNPQSLSDGTVRLGQPVPPTYLPQLERLLGAEFTARVMELPLNEWYGPLQSLRGQHFVRITSRQPEQPMAWNEIKPILMGRWTQAKEEEIIREEVAKISAEWRVVLPKAQALEQKP